MKRLQFEMGGKNPLLVLDNADLDLPVGCAVNGAFYGTGQRCTASARLIVTPGIHDHFVQAVVARLKDLNIGHPLDPQTHIGPVVDQCQLDTNLRHLDIGKQENAVLHWWGECLKRPTQDSSCSQHCLPKYSPASVLPGKKSSAYRNHRTG
jgi:aldehyde dehydrogenase (NAD+)